MFTFYPLEQGLRHHSYHGYHDSYEFTFYPLEQGLIQLFDNHWVSPNSIVYLLSIRTRTLVNDYPPMFPSRFFRLATAWFRSFSHKGYKLKCIMRWEVSHITDTRRKMKNACPQHVVYFEIIYKFAKTEWHGQQPSFWNIQTETGSQKMMNSRTAKQWCLSSTALD